MSSHSDAPVNGRLEKPFVGDEFCFPRRTDFWGYSSPHCGDDDDVFQRVVPTKLAKHLEISRGYSPHSDVGNPMEIEESMKSHPGFVAVKV